MHYVYVLMNNVTGRYYIGYTPDLRKRVAEHETGKVKSTKSNLNYCLVYYSAFETKRLALDFERYLKTGSGIAFMKKRFLKSSGASAKRIRGGDPLLEARRA